MDTGTGTIYTEGQVLLAHLTNALDSDKRAQHARTLADLGLDEGKEELATREADYQAGMAILEGARLVSSRRWATGTGHTAYIDGGLDSPEVAVRAGYLATQEMWRWVGLRRKAK